MTERVRIYSEWWISLVVPEKQDAEVWYKWMNNPEINQYMWPAVFGNLKSKEKAEERFLRLNNSKEDDNIYFWIFDDNADKFLWEVCLADIDFTARKAELWISILDITNTSKWIWTKAISMILKHAFDVLWLHKVYFEVLWSNERAIACYNKCWFEEVGRLKKHYYRMWKYHDQVWMEKFNEKK